MVTPREVFQDFGLVADRLRFYLREKGSLFAPKALWHKIDRATQTANDLTNVNNIIRVFVLLNVVFLFFGCSAKMQTIFRTKMWGRITIYQKVFFYFKGEFMGYSSQKERREMFWRHLTAAHSAPISKIFYIKKKDIHIFKSCFMVVLYFKNHCIYCCWLCYLYFFLFDFSDFEFFFFFIFLNSIETKNKMILRSILVQIVNYFVVYLYIVFTETGFLNLASQWLESMNGSGINSV